AITAAKLGSMVDQDLGDLTRSHAALQAKDGHSQLDQMIKPVADAMAAPGPQLGLAKRHPELPQVPQLVDQLLAQRLAARERPRDLPMHQAEIERGHEIRSNSTFDIGKGAELLAVLGRFSGCRVPWGSARDAVERDPNSGLPRPLRVLSDLFAR